MPTRWLQLHVGSVAKSLGTFLVARLSQYSWAYECEQATQLLTDIENVCLPESSPNFHVFSRGSILSIHS